MLEYIDHTDDCPVFKATSRDMGRPFEKFVESIEAESLSFGICKITAPRGWTSASQEQLNMSQTIKYIKQSITLKPGSVGTYLAEITQPKRPQRLEVFEARAEMPESKGREMKTFADLEAYYWHTIPGTVEYGADLDGTRFHKSVKHWNIGALDSCLSRGLKNCDDSKIKGVTTPYLYYGKWKATFAWHTEDMDLHSVNFLHSGKPKLWYCVAPKDRDRLDELFRKKLSYEHASCPQFMRHKHVLMKPEVIEAAGIKVHRVVQYPGDFIINFPGAYHAGFNTGFNCAESTNFATKSWIEHGARATWCECVDDSVKFGMDLLLPMAKDEATRQIIIGRMTDEERLAYEGSNSNSDLGTADSTNSVQASTSTQSGGEAQSKKKVQAAPKAAQAYSKAKSKLDTAGPQKPVSRKELVQDLKQTKLAQHATTKQQKKLTAKFTQKKPSPDAQPLPAKQHKAPDSKAPQKQPRPEPLPAHPQQQRPRALQWVQPANEQQQQQQQQQKGHQGKQTLAHVPAPPSQPTGITRAATAARNTHQMPAQPSPDLPQQRHATKSPANYAPSSAQQSDSKQRVGLGARLLQTGMAMLRSYASRPSSAAEQFGEALAAQPGEALVGCPAEADGHSPGEHQHGAFAQDGLLGSPRASNSGELSGNDASNLGRDGADDAAAQPATRRQKRKARQHEVDDAPTRSRKRQTRQQDTRELPGEPLSTAPQLQWQQKRKRSVRRLIAHEHGPPLFQAFLQAEKRQRRDEIYLTRLCPSKQ